MLNALFARFARSSEWDVAAAALAGRFVDKVSLSVRPGSTAYDRAVDALVADAKGVARAKSWGSLKSICFANALRWRLIESGIGSNVADEVAREVALALAHGRRNGKLPPRAS